ncbi:MAG: tRNA (adenosine(37)-N6)-dimethylallyltransferase MiaA [Defluviitaleaceae bacterium]|nr:tRNA (adenosine(37)-N6)-dimethylallyltransferase MiaA [Defluviitaleaceae bacterium]MCL2240167.1 tRNA (adenosine(37)-N6)-dimethylallyltransferase MiaA [Defluviitaleaceae bacterium]
MLYVIAGPTASGKTAVAVALAHMVKGEVVNADSMQVYKGMDIGTAKPTLEERGGIPHHVLDVASPGEPFSAARYKALAQEAIARIHQRGNVPILAGGTGFYINAVVYDTDFSGETGSGTALRNQYTRLAMEKGGDYLHDLLSQRDAQAAAAIHPHNIKRVARALAFCESTGTLFSAHNAQQREKKHRDIPRDTVFVILDIPRDELYSRINKRTEEMLAAGLEREVAGLLEAGFSPNLPAMQGIGYKQIAQRATRPPILSQIQQATRNYAKRQITWFKHNAPHARWIDASSGDAQAIAREILHAKER